MGKNPTKSQKEQPSYDIRDVVLAKVRGFPPWPGMVVDPDSVPSSVTKERPSSKKTTFYCVRFFPAGDYAWLVSKDISKLQTHEIESYINEPYKRSGDLLKGYQIALDPTKWEQTRDAAGGGAADEDATDEVDQLDSENDDDTKKSSKTKKRKRESDAAPQKSKAKPKPRKGSDEPASKKKLTSKPKKSGSKSKAMVESEDDADHGDGDGDDDDAGPSKKTSPPPAKKSKRDKDGDEEVDASVASDPEALKVREWRHKLQKTFLSTKTLPKDEDMPGLDQLFRTVEEYERINIQYLTFSKIGKVMRHIALLAPDKVPRDDEFKFRDRANALVGKWHQILHENKPNGTDNGANGAVKVDGGAEQQEAVVEGTAAMDLNGKTDEAMPIPIPEVVAADGDTSVLADITMSEA